MASLLAVAQPHPAPDPHPQPQLLPQRPTARASAVVSTPGSISIQQHEKRQRHCLTRLGSAVAIVWRAPAGVLAFAHALPLARSRARRVVWWLSV
ncbi:unnamed protein product [Amoebophrya sp. A25]|nr:unnamed protein product [Amoebophrya sp. A25]|eukprot:GSA25T00002765001.1